ncbi:BspA family leucine-rich repeat surface protein [Bifidobacterium sp. ESL0763]|uniref:BspA family leucine-rich repeat surface protein n=1 Tax=Bifidobacterium sp. ESL0763 TaxID=2983227 RepID=UPI0023F7B824|nr:BspA family leucine-rich repeat surface protein [Bifidobacterium sp. ESL0763]MDF7664475.1 BspA family leucine-rich repeat surface protein [Bifidobacterium sp. ESL0763]
MNKKLTIAVGVLAAAATLSMPAFSNAVEINESHPETTSTTQVAPSNGQTAHKLATKDQSEAPKAPAAHRKAADNATTESRNAAPQTQESQDTRSYTRGAGITVTHDSSTGVVTIKADPAGGTYDSSDRWSDDSGVTKIQFTGGTTRLPSGTSYLFGQMPNLTEITGLDHVDTSGVTDMEWTFAEDPKLGYLDLSGWDTSNVTNMAAMFSDSGLTHVKLDGLVTSKVTDMNGIFANCHKLTSLDASSWDTSGVTDLNGAFTSCWNLANINIDGWSTAANCDASLMFYNCVSLTNFTGTGFDTSNVINMMGMFYRCLNLANVQISNWDTSNVQDMSSMFGDTALTSLNLNGWNTSAATMTDMLADCTGLAQISVGPATKLASNANLPAAPTTAPHTGSWIQLAIPATPSATADETTTYAAADLLTRTQSTSDTTVPGTYVLQQKHTLTLQANAPTGTQPDAATQASDIFGGVGTDVPAYNAAGTLLKTYSTLGTKTAVPANPFTLSDDGADASQYHFTKWIDPTTHAAHEPGDTMDFPDGDVALNAQWADRSGTPAPGSDPGSTPGQPGDSGQPDNNNAGKPGTDNPKLVQTGATVLPIIAIMTVALLAAGIITVRNTKAKAAE